MNTKNASTPIRIFIPVLLPFAAGATAGTPATGAGAAGWVAPHLVQNLAPSASGFPQLTQNAAIEIASVRVLSHHILPYLNSAIPDPARRLGSATRLHVA